MNLGLRHGASYGALGAPLAFAALPLYVLLPSHYAATLGVPLAGLGAVLLGTRALDALIDPALGRGADRLLAGARPRTLAWAAGGALLLTLGLAALFMPPVALQTHPASLLAWCAAALAVTCLGYSGLGVLHQAWGARLGGDAAQQARLVGWREGLALAGVLLASLLPSLAGVSALVAVCAAGLALALAALAAAPYPNAHGGHAPRPAAGIRPWRVPAFRRLMAVFVLNGVAGAVPATLLLFFVSDRLQAPAWQPLFLGGYFATAALAMPLWVRAVPRFGLLRCWLAGMLLAVCAFVAAARLGAGDVAAFTAICLVTGAALGADLALPGALLTGVIQRAGHARGGEGAYVGWWTCANKLNLALAAGLALPALQWLGYTPGGRDAAGLQALSIAYAALPCLLKAGAATLLWQQRHHLEPT
ncbi:MAG: MFS transporter [Burkholderiaceae bacterium]|nr:MFS transporter [Burkholderiaceae bacterium]